MYLRVKRADGSVIQEVSDIYVCCLRHGFLFEGKAYRSERMGVFLSGELRFVRNPSLAASATARLMEELGADCTGGVQPHMCNSLNGPTAIIGFPVGVLEVARSV